MGTRCVVHYVADADRFSRKAAKTQSCFSRARIGSVARARTAQRWQPVALGKAGELQRAKPQPQVLS